MLNECVNDVMTKVEEKGRVVKTSHKKKYILNSLQLAHLRVASIYVVVLDNSSAFVGGDNPEMRATLRSDSSSNASSSNNNFNQTLTRLQNVQALNKKKILPPSQ